MKYNFRIRGVIGSWWYGMTAEDVNYFLSKHKDEELDIAICSPGGSVSEGLEIYQAFKDHGKIHAHIIGMTASIATIIAMGAQSVDMVKGSLILIHNSSAAVEEWRMANKEELDAIIAKYKKQREDLKTIDDLMASIYSAKTGKSLDECLEKMKKAAWITADDALAFGLVDSVRTDAEDVKAVALVADTQYTDNIIKDFGLPALPHIPTENAQPTARGGIDGLVDGEGNPTESFLQKTWQGLKELFRNNHADKSNTMDKKYKKVSALLGYEYLAEQDGHVSLKAEDLQKVESHVSALEEKAAQAGSAKKEAEAKATGLQAQLDTMKATLAEKESEIENLKKAPATKVDEQPEEAMFEATDSAEGLKLFNAVTGNN